MAGQIEGQHRAAAMGEAARLQGPDDVVHAGAMEHDHRGLVGLENGRPPVAAKTGLPSTSKLHGGAQRLLRGAQGLGQIVDDVARRLEADREAHQILADAGGLPAPRRSSAEWVVLAGWITRVLASPTLARCESELQRLDEARARLAPALDAEAR